METTENVKDSKHWITAYMVKCESISFIIAIIYRPPSYSKAEFCKGLQQFLEELCENSNDIIIVGAFNIDWQSDFYKSKLESLLNDNGLKRIMKEFTRITKNSKTLIDYIITNNEMVSAKNNTNNKITDHECIDIFIENGNGRKIQNKEMDILKYNKEDRFNNELSAIIEFNEIDNIHEYVYNFDTSFERTIERFIVKRKLRENNNNKWFSNELRMLKREKIIKYQKGVFENSASAWSRYKFI